jgi:hypothetical protein
MSMILCLSTLRDDNLAKVLADPPLVWKVIAPDDPEMYETARAGSSKTTGSFLKRFFGRESRDGAPTNNLMLDDDELGDTDLDKAWHGIHFMLTQTAWEGSAPLNFLLIGGTEIGDIDVGYGPARGMTSMEVRTVAEALQDIDESFMRARFDSTLMMELEIYPTIWDRDPDEDDTFGYCMEYFLLLRNFVTSASERGMGLIISLM